MHLSSQICSMMLMEVVQNQIQSFIGGHMEFGHITMMLKIQNNALFGVISEEWRAVRSIIGDLDIVNWDILITIPID